MTPITRRTWLRAAATATCLSGPGLRPSLRASQRERAAPPVRPNILYALSTGTWGQVTIPGKPLPLLQILDETAEAGFNGVRLTGFPAILEQNGLSLQQYGDELEKRGLKFSTVSF